MHLRRKLDPPTEPVSVQEAKEHLRIDTDWDDDLLFAYIQTAREMIEEYLGRALITQTWDMILDTLPERVELPRPPVQEVNGVYARDASDNEYEISSDHYTMEEKADLLMLSAQSVVTWPFHRDIAGARIEFVSGYGDSASDIPPPLRVGILQMVGHLYENRESQAIPPGVRQIIQPYRRVRI